MSKNSSALRKIVNNPFANLAVGLILFATSLMEAWDTLADDLSSANFGSHHGVMVFAALQIVKTFPDLMESLEYMEKGK